MGRWIWGIYHCLYAQRSAEIPEEPVLLLCNFKALWESPGIFTVTPGEPTLTREAGCDFMGS